MAVNNNIPTKVQPWDSLGGTPEYDTLQKPVDPTSLFARLANYDIYDPLPAEKSLPEVKIFSSGSISFNRPNQLETLTEVNQPITPDHPKTLAGFDIVKEAGDIVTKHSEQLIKGVGELTSDAGKAGLELLKALNAEGSLINSPLVPQPNSEQSRAQTDFNYIKDRQQNLAAATRRIDQENTQSGIVRLMKRTAGFLKSIVFGLLGINQNYERELTESDIIAAESQLAEQEQQQAQAQANQEIKAASKQPSATEGAFEGRSGQVGSGTGNISAVGGAG